MRAVCVCVGGGWGAFSLTQHSRRDEVRLSGMGGRWMVFSLPQC